MNQLLSITFIALTIFIQNYGCTKVEPQVKAIDVERRYMNTKYFKALEYSITNVNATFNQISVRYEVIKDLPVDVKLVSKVYVTDSSYENGRLLLVDETPICRRSSHHNLLPGTLSHYESQFNQPCWKKGVYDLKKIGQFRFEHLVPDLHEEGDYYRTEYTMGTDSEPILKVTVFSEWGYLNNY